MYQYGLTGQGVACREESRPNLAEQGLGGDTIWVQNMQANCRLYQRVAGEKRLFGRGLTWGIAVDARASLWANPLPHSKPC